MPQVPLWEKVGSGEVYYEVAILIAVQVALPFVIVPRDMKTANRLDKLWL